ncbi:MAG: hypothetical protein WDW36_004717 [Sanguina aurantia]
MGVEAFSEGASSVSPKAQDDSSSLTAQPVTPHTDHSSPTPFNLTPTNTPPPASASEVLPRPVFPRSRQLFLPPSASSSLAGSEDQCLAGSWDDLSVPAPPWAPATALLPDPSPDCTSPVADTVHGRSTAGSLAPVIHSLHPLVIPPDTLTPGSKTGSASGDEHDSRARLSDPPRLHAQAPASQQRRLSIDGRAPGSPPQQHATSVPVHAPSPTGSMHPRTSPPDPMLCHPSMIMMDRRQTRTASRTGEGLQLQLELTGSSSSSNRRQRDTAQEQQQQQQQQHLLPAAEPPPPTESPDTTTPPVHQRAPIYPSAGTVIPVLPPPAGHQHSLPSPPPTPSPQQLHRPFISLVPPTGNNLEHALHTALPELYSDTRAPSAAGSYTHHHETHESSRTGPGHTPQRSSPSGLLTPNRAPLTPSCSAVSDHDRRLTPTPTSLVPPPLWLPDHNVLDRIARHSSTHIPSTHSPSSFHSTHTSLPQLSSNGSRPASNCHLSITRRHSSTGGAPFASPSLHGSIPGPRLCRSSSGSCGNITHLPASPSPHGSAVAVAGPPEHHRSSSSVGGGGGGGAHLPSSSPSPQHSDGFPAHRHSDGAIAAIAAIAFEAYPHRALRGAAETATAAQEALGGGVLRMWNAPSPRRSSQPGDAELGRAGVRMRARSVSESGVPV